MPAEVTNPSVDPAPEQFQAFLALRQDTPIHMLNLLRFRSLAAYPQDHPNHGRGLSGAAAYRLYGHGTAPILQRVGGRLIWVGRPEVTVIGPIGERWDLAFIAEYPHGAAFAAMIRDPDYRKIVAHRQAALADSRLIRHVPLTAEQAFGE